MDFQDYKNMQLSLPEGQFKNIYVINNAGSLGDLEFASEASLSVGPCIDANVTGVMVFTSGMLRWAAATHEGVRVVVINVSSLAALKPLPGMSTYCVTKAARNMYFRCLAAEAEEDPALKKLKLRVLSYSPGPMDTDMGTFLRENVRAGSTKTAFENLKQQDNYVDVDASAHKMTQLTMSDKYENGAHIDYYDVPDI